MEDLINEYTLDALEEWEEDDEMETYETAFIRGASYTYSPRRLNNNSGLMDAA